MNQDIYVHDGRQGARLTITSDAERVHETDCSGQHMPQLQKKTEHLQYMRLAAIGLSGLKRSLYRWRERAAPAPSEPDCLDCTSADSLKFRSTSPDESGSKWCLARAQTMSASKGRWLARCRAKWRTGVDSQ
jgi:hypothetical protein